MKLFLDANVLFTAAHNQSGKAALVIDLAKEGSWEIVTCAFAVEEARRNLQLKYSDTLKSFEKILRSIEIAVTTLSGDRMISLPPKDMPIFLTALKLKCTHLLTGDLKHFGKYMNQPKKSGGIIIQTVAGFLDSL